MNWSDADKSLTEIKKRTYRKGLVVGAALMVGVLCALMLIGDCAKGQPVIE